MTFPQYAFEIFSKAREVFNAKGILILTEKALFVAGSPYLRDRPANDNEAK